MRHYFVQIPLPINSLAPGRFEWNFRLRKICTLILMMAEWISLDFTDTKSRLFQVVAWRRQASNHYPRQCWSGSMSPKGVSSPLASYLICKIAGCACAGLPGTFSPPRQVSDPDMHDVTSVTHVPWCIPGSLTSAFLWSLWPGKRSRHSRRMQNPQVYVSGKRLMMC